MIENRKISVIISVYNVGSFLKRCLDSVCEQTYRNIEIIIVNDGSTDNSNSICEEYKKKDARIHLIHQSNSGVSKARNMGLSEMSGDYVCFVDSDDYLELNYIEELCKLISQPGIQMAICAFVEESEDGTVKRIGYRPQRSLTQEQVMEQVFFSEGIGRSLWNKIFKTDIIKNNQLKFDSNYIIAEDMIFLFYYINKSNLIIQSFTTLYHYQCRSGSAMNQRLWNDFYYKRSSSWLNAMEDLITIIPQVYTKCLRKCNVYNILVKYRILCESVSLPGYGGNERKQFEKVLLKAVRRHGYLIILSNDIPSSTKMGLILSCISPSLHSVAAKQKRML